MKHPSNNVDIYSESYYIHTFLYWAIKTVLKIVQSFVIYTIDRN